MVALAGGATFKDAAEQAGINERTARRWMDAPAFRKQVDDTRAEMLAQAVAKLTSASTAAVETLQALLSSEMDFARLAAARTILEVGMKLREQHDLAERVAALEERLGEQVDDKQPRPWSETRQAKREMHGGTR